jgi:dipeptidyl aminopeptidase/acylaminoacyl peptidase
MRERQDSTEVKLNRRVIRLPLGVLLAAALLVGYLWLYGQINAELDEKIFHQLRGEVPGTPADRGLPYEDVSFSTPEGLTLRGWLIPGSPEEAIVLASGYIETRWNVLKYAPFLHRAGYTLLLFDPRGTGESDGELYAFGAYEPEDIHAAVEYLKTRGFTKIGLFGHSNGATAALIAASQLKLPVVADSSFANLRLAAKSAEKEDPLLQLLFPLYNLVARARLGFDLFQRTNALRVVDRVSRVLFIHGLVDDYIAPENSFLLWNRAGEPKDLWLVPEAKHVESFDAAPEEYARRVSEFFGRYLN